ncbi:glycoside hydrolase family 76 protein, partial [Corynebacterium stationis]
MKEKWSHRADLAESAIHDRHATSVWSLPRTNLAVVSWPPVSKERLFVHWHYWWQAHYVDCQVDAALRHNTKTRRKRIADTLRGIRRRNITALTKNRYYDDKLWLALAMDRVAKLPKMSRPKSLTSLQKNILDGRDKTFGVLPWREGETFLNVPTNGPAAIMLARMGRIDEARHIVDWIYDNLVDDDGFIMDGLRMRMDGPELVRNIHPYCQGVVLGACLEI